MGRETSSGGSGNCTNKSNGKCSGSCADARRERRAAPTTPAASPAAGKDLAPWGSVVDRRLGLDRRQLELEQAGGMAGVPAGSEPDTGLERRRGPGRRRTDFTKSAEEGEMTSEQFLFIMAIDAFKKANGRMFPTWTDVLEVVRLLGYRKTMPSELNLSNAEDWLEKPDTASGVRSKPGHPEVPRSRSRDAA